MAMSPFLWLYKLSTPLPTCSCSGLNACSCAGFHSVFWVIGSLCTTSICQQHMNAQPALELGCNLSIESIDCCSKCLTQHCSMEPPLTTLSLPHDAQSLNCSSVA